MQQKQKNNGKLVEQRINNERLGTPRGNKAVSFLSAKDLPDNGLRRDHSSSTEPLVTDSCSDSDLNDSKDKLTPRSFVASRIDRS